MATVKKEMTQKGFNKLSKALKLPLSLCLMPTNYKEERKKFLSDWTSKGKESRSPQFKYKKVRNDNVEVLKKLEQVTRVSDVDPYMSEYMLETVNDKILTNLMMSAIGKDEEFSRLAVKKYGLPTKVLRRNARRIIKKKLKLYKELPDKEKTDQEEDMLSSDEVLSIANEIFEKLKLEDWHTEYSQRIGGNFKLGAKRKAIYLSKKSKYSKSRLKKSFVHEIGTHALRSYNAELAGFYFLTKSNVTEYLATEEGLAGYNEYSWGFLTKSVLLKYALRAWGVLLTQTMGFTDMFEVLSMYMGTKSCFELVFRLKRGLSDTSNPGGYPKDKIYLEGFLKVRRALEKDNTLYSNLYAGKIPLSKAWMVEDGIIPKPKIVPSKERFEKVFESVGL